MCPCSLAPSRACYGGRSEDGSSFSSPIPIQGTFSAAESLCPGLSCLDRFTLGEGDSSVGEVPGTLKLELRTQGKHQNSLGLALCARGVGAGKGLEKGSEEGRSRELYSHEE